MNQSKNTKILHGYKRFIFLMPMVASNQIFANYEIEKDSINNGGGKANSQRFEIQASIAQVDANLPMISNTYQLSSGFWQQNTDLIFTNGFK